jgi:hypothetical protein
MSILGAIARYLAVMGIAAGVGLMLTRLGIGLAAASGSDTSEASTYIGLWIIISLIVSMVLAGVSFFFLGVENADRVSHHAGRAIGNSVTLTPVTHGEMSWKWRVGLLWVLMFATEFFVLQ